MDDKEGLLNCLGREAPLGFGLFGGVSLSFLWTFLRGQNPNFPGCFPFFGAVVSPRVLSAFGITFFGWGPFNGEFWLHDTYWGGPWGF